MRRTMMIFAWLWLVWGICASQAIAAGAGQYTNFKVFTQNDLGMHCVDKDFSVFSILPPFNVLNAQVIGQDANGKPVVLNSSQVKLMYSPVPNTPNPGYINSTSKTILSGPNQGQPKSNFWTYAKPLFGLGAALPAGQGLTGLYMPGDAKTQAQKSLSWDMDKGLFSAAGVPVLPVNDDGGINHYPLLKVTAYDSVTGAVLASNTPVLPVSEETTCAGCHDGSGAGTPDNRGIVWSAAPNDEVRVRENILILHDFNHAAKIKTLLGKKPLMRSKPVLCASCHYSAALDLAGTGPSAIQAKTTTTMSGAMHGFHADLMPPPLVDSFPLPGENPPRPEDQSCYQCHPGKDTKCLRGAMTETVTCQSCHGDMAAVGGGKIDLQGRHTALPLPVGGGLDGKADGGTARRPWQDLPGCQSCHIGDAVNHKLPAGAVPSLDKLRLQVAFNPDDPSASPFKAPGSRFAENPGTLFRFSKGHGGVACEGCHGSTHAIWPADNTLNPNDNLVSAKLQGHAGTVMECATCHNPAKLKSGLNGPHGMHVVGGATSWANGGHGDFAEHNTAACQTCHGTDWKGTALSRVADKRTFRNEFGTVALNKGDVVGCYTCHNGPHPD